MMPKDMNYKCIMKVSASARWKDFFKLLIPFYGYLFSLFVGLILRYKANECGENPKCLVNLAYNFGRFSLLLRPFSIKPNQVYSEILSLAKIIHKLKPKAIVEIGTAGGGTLFIWCRLASDDATIISIDLPGGPFGGGYPAWKIPLYKSFAKYGQKIHLIRTDSHDPKTLETVKKLLMGRSLDLLFIDGDHTYQGVKRDFEMYSPLVRRGGLIVFHDIVEHPPESGCLVSKFWNEIKHRYTYEEIVEGQDQRWAGIGVLYV